MKTIFLAIAMAIVSLSVPVACETLRNKNDDTSAAAENPNEHRELQWWDTPIRDRIRDRLNPSPTPRPTPRPTAAPTQTPTLKAKITTSRPTKCEYFRKKTVSVREVARVVVETIPEGAKEVVVLLKPVSGTTDLELFDGTTRIVSNFGGVIDSAGPQERTYAGMEIQYSGYAPANGEEFIVIPVEATEVLTVQVYAYAGGGTAEVTVSYFCP